MQRTAVLGTVGGDEQRCGRREGGGECGEDVVAGCVDPVGVLDDEHGPGRACPDGLRHHLDQSATPGVRADLWRRPVGSIDAHGVEQDSRVGRMRCQRPRALGHRVFAGFGGVEPVHREHGAQQARQRAERDRGGVGFAAGNDNGGTPTRGDRGELRRQAALAQPGIADDPDEAAAIGIEQLSQLVHLGLAAQHEPFVAAQHRPIGFHAEKPACGYSRVRALDGDVFYWPEPGRVLHEACRGQRAQHPAGRRGRLHALRHADGMADRGK